MDNATTHDQDTPGADETYTDRRRRLWLSQPFLPLLPVAGCGLALWSGLSIFYWIAPIFWFGVVALLDELLPKDSNNPPPQVLPKIEKDQYYERVLMASLPAYLINLVFVCWFVSTYPLSLFGYVGLTVSVGIVSGLGLAVGHELAHKTAPSRKWFGKLFLSLAGVGQFIVAHLRKHHVQVATPPDLASAPMGESLYHFGARRQQPGFFRESWALEKERLARQDKSVWSLHNETLQQYLVTGTVYGALTLAFGWIVLPLLLLQMYVCWWYLSLIEYCQHYGLKRQMQESGKYEPPGEEHSWNTNMIVSNNLLLNFVRHSPHHLRTTRWFQALRDHRQAPELPYCYSIMFLAAMVPPIFYRLMDHRVVDWADGDLDKLNIYEPAEARIRARYATASQ